MADGRSHDDPKIRRRTSGKLVGPFMLYATPDGTPLYMYSYSYSYSEVVIFDWPGRSDDWQRKVLPVKQSGDRLFPNGSIRAEDIQILAWPCSMSGDGYEDA